MDYHVHSNFSGDCSVEPEDIIRDAINNGLKEICFTDHIDYDCPDLPEKFEFDSSEYFESMSRLKEKYSDKIDVKIGVEIGLQGHVLKECSEFVNTRDFDFVIASFHTHRNKDIYFTDILFQKTPHEVLSEYLDEILYSINNYNDYSVIGHLDLLKRYSNGIKDLDVKDYFEKYSEIFKILIENGKGIEINTSGLRQDVGVQFPDKELLKLYKELGGKIITLGSDTHGTGTLMYKFDEMKQILKEIGFKNIYMFEKRMPVKVQI